MFNGVGGYYKWIWICNFWYVIFKYELFEVRDYLVLDFLNDVRFMWIVVVNWDYKVIFMVVKD